MKYQKGLVIDKKSGQEVRICQAPGCDDPIGNDRRRRYCRVCAEIIDGLRRQQRRDKNGETKRSGRICALEGCEILVLPPRRRHCSDHCAAKAQREQSRKSSEIKRRMKRALSKSKHERHGREVRTIRTMQNVPAERWDQYDFIK